MNTLVWLANFPVSNGYAMIFIGAFSLMGLGMMTFGGGTTGDGKLQKVRAAQGLPEARSGEELRAGLRTARRILSGLLLICMGPAWRWAFWASAGAASPGPGSTSTAPPPTPPW
jgi:hypothetical protein